MKKSTVIGIVAGLAAGIAATVAGTVAVNKVKKEIKSDLSERIFTSPEGDKTVHVSFGSSKSAKGLTYMRVLATSESCEDTCKLSLLARKVPEVFEGAWKDNDHFTLEVGKRAGKRQCCDVTFDEDRISALLAWKKFEA